MRRPGPGGCPVRGRQPRRGPRSGGGGWGGDPGGDGTLSGDLPPLGRGRMTMHRGRRRAAVSVLIVVSVLLSAPGGGRRKEAGPEPAPAVLPQGPKGAVAPMENQTNDL